MTFIESIKKSFIYILLTIGLGVLWHFLCDWLGESSVISIVAPVNESTWEHLKLLFYPVLIISIIEYLFRRMRTGFFVARSKGILYGITTIIVLFCTYMGVVGIHNTVVSITIYIIGVFVSYGMSGYYYQKRSSTFLSWKIISALIIITFIVLFAVFTFHPPSIHLFAVPKH